MSRRVVPREGVGFWVLGAGKKQLHPAPKTQNPTPLSDSGRGDLRQARRALARGRRGLRGSLLERLAEDLADVFDEDELHLAEQLLRDFIHVAPVELWQDDFGDARAPRRQNLLLDAADGQDVATQGNLARHR